jgi:hypothetical protein
MGSVRAPPVRDGRCTKSLTEETAHSDPYLGFTSHFTVKRPEPERALTKYE